MLFLIVFRKAGLGLFYMRKLNNIASQVPP